MSGSGRMVRRVVSIGVAVALGVGVFVGGRVLMERLDGGDADVEVAADAIGTASASIGSLTRTLEASGTIAYEPAVAVQSTLTGTVLEIVAPGTIVSSGDVLARIDDRAIVWLTGDVPAWRSLGVGDEGDDVEQLEIALTDLGFNSGDVTVDAEYTEATATMVERWQESLDLEPTGDVELGTVVVGSSRDRVAAVGADVGDRVTPGALVHLGSDERIARLDVDPADAAHLTVGDEIDANLPDRTAVTATVTEIVEAADSWTVTAAVDDADLATRDTITIESSWQHTVAADVLTVPSSALLRLDDGGYVVDVMDEGGELDRRRVTLGVSEGTRTEILSGLAAGDLVLML